MLVARDDEVSLGDARQSYDVVVPGVWCGCCNLVWVRAKLGPRPEQRDERLRLLPVEPLREFGPGQHVGKFVEQLGANNQLDLALPPRSEYVPTWAPWLEQSRDQDIRVRDDPEPGLWTQLRRLARGGRRARRAPG